jgi:hypothetical protein
MEWDLTSHNGDMMEIEKVIYGILQSTMGDQRELINGV